MDPGFTLTLNTGHLHNFGNLAIVLKKKKKGTEATFVHWNTISMKGSRNIY